MTKSAASWFDRSTGTPSWDRSTGEPMIRWLGADADARVVGGKAAGLAWAHQAGLFVPSGFVVTAAALNSGAGEREGGLDDDVVAAIGEAYGELTVSTSDSGRAGRPLVAVRSSAEVEDGREGSYAGQFSTRLDVTDFEGVLAAVDECRRRAVDAAPYAAALELGGEGAMAVVVQLQVDPAFAGVAMSLHPITGDRSRVTLEFCRGLGVAVVMGEDVHRLEIDKITGEMWTLPDGGEELVLHRTDEPVGGMSRDMAAQVVAAVTTAQRAVGRHVDVEWALEIDSDPVFGGGQPPLLWILQVRPETVKSVWPSTGSSPSARSVSALWSQNEVDAPAVFPRPSEVMAGRDSNSRDQVYPECLRFNPDGSDDDRFWFRDTIHYPDVVAPFDATIFWFAQMALAQYNSRYFVIPDALGVDFRILDGWVYLSPVQVGDPDETAQRDIAFQRRAGNYYANWDAIYATWVSKVTALIGDMAELRVTVLPLIEPENKINERIGLGSTYDLLSTYWKLIDAVMKLWQYHFELLNLGYAAYVNFARLCNELFPAMNDMAIVSMVSGIQADLYRPDDELRGLAQKLLDSDLLDQVDPHDWDATFDQLSTNSCGRAWIAAWEKAADPWFNVNDGTGQAHTDRCWRDYPEIPLGAVVDYARAAGKASDRKIPRRDVGALERRRKEIVGSYAETLSQDEKRDFLQHQSLAEAVFGFVEGHNFYIEHWGQSVFWAQMREMGTALVAGAVIAKVDDVFLLTRYEVDEALLGAATSWAVGRPSSDSGRWLRTVERRRHDRVAQQRWDPPLVLGKAPDKITEPFTIMLWGIDDHKLAQWSQPEHAGSSDKALHGRPVSVGIATGPVRVVRSEADLTAVQAGDILVVRVMLAAWASVLLRAAAVVSESGGIMSHGAIICREFGVPSVAGVRGATQIPAGSVVRVDGNIGLVTPAAGQA